MTPDQLARLRDKVPRIEPVEPGIARPYWSVIIPTCNRSTFIAQTLSSVLEQDPGVEHMQILVMDDASDTQDSRAIVERLGGGRVSWHRQPARLGQFANVNDGIRRATGRWIHVLHDDDWVLPDFYANIRRSVHQQAGAVLTSIRILDAAGNEYDRPLERDEPAFLDNWLSALVTRPCVQTPAVVVRRLVYETTGGYSLAFSSPGDWEMWQRIASHYRWWYEPQAVACYRIHADSNSSRAKAAASNIAQMRAVIAFAQDYVPQRFAQAISTHSIRMCRALAINAVKRMMESGNYQGAAAQIIECLITDDSQEAVKAMTSISAGFQPSERVRLGRTPDRA